MQELASKFLASQAKQLANNVMKHDDFVGALSATIITKIGSSDLSKLNQHDKSMVSQMLVDAASVITTISVDWWFNEACRAKRDTMMTNMGRLVGFLHTFDNHEALVSKWVMLAREFHYANQAIWVVHRLIKVLAGSPCMRDDTSLRKYDDMKTRARQRIQVVDMLVDLCSTFRRKCYPALQHSKVQLFVALAEQGHAMLLEDMVVFGAYNCPNEMSWLIIALSNVIEYNSEAHEGCWAWRVLRALHRRWPVQFSKQFVNHLKVVTRAIKLHVCEDVRRFLIQLTAVWSLWSDVGLVILEQIKMLNLPDDKQVGLFQQLLEHKVIRQAFVDAGGLKVLSISLSTAVWWKLCAFRDELAWDLPRTKRREAARMTLRFRLSCSVWTRLCWLMSSIKPTKHDKYGRLAIKTMRRLFI